ncbi:MAG: hypothetical protein KJ852_12165 [Gammaproteobacteria bacterium]|nr:hypothetical protein [Gammaproteobacteria bacterium]MBU0786566.1 hypothetical protein [Gammaproteobacteria bacterium]MBU0817174.1 hypothetical protein [Gammaproteobacteria bacterium]MBU1787705.1 hypothetical protein [Gammaproteobacteria bacterium]
MSFFSNIRIKRRIASAMVLVWMFALSTGWANACVLQDSGTHIHESDASSSFAVEVPIVSPGHAGADSGHEENSDVGKSACLKVCGDGAKTIGKSTSSFDLTTYALAPPPAITWIERLTVATASNSLLETPTPESAVPLRTRFSRLVL